MRPAFPASDYYGGSVPHPARPPTVGLSEPHSWTERGPEDRCGSRVHLRSVDRHGGQLCPGGLTTARGPAAETADAAGGDAERTPLPAPVGVRTTRPAQIRQVRAGST